MPSALFEIYQKNFEKSLKRLSERLELYQKQSKEDQSITLTETELNISEMERAISQMELEVIIEKIPDNKKKLNKIIEANKNIVKQYKREIQDLKFKEQSILNKKNFAKIYSNKKNEKSELNLLKNKNNNIISDDEDIALFINKNSTNDINIFNNDNFRDELNLKKDEEIKRINDHPNKIGENKEDNIVINNTNDIDFFYNFTNYNGNFSNNINKSKTENKTDKKKDIEDKDAQDNKYKKNKNNFFTQLLKLLKIIISLIKYIIYFCHQKFIQLKNYLHRKYGYTNGMRILLALGIISFIIIYSLFVFLFASKKIDKENNDKINLIKNNTALLEDIKKDLNETKINLNINTNKTNLVNENNATNMNNINEKNISENQT